VGVTTAAVRFSSTVYVHFTSQRYSCQLTFLKRFDYVIIIINIYLYHNLWKPTNVFLSFFLPTSGPGWRSRLATRYGLAIRGSNAAPVQTGPGVNPACCNMRTVSLSPGVKRPELGVNHLAPSTAEVKGRIELFLYSPLGPSWSVLA